MTPLRSLLQVLLQEYGHTRASCSVPSGEGLPERTIVDVLLGTDTRRSCLYDWVVGTNEVMFAVL